MLIPRANRAMRSSLTPSAAARRGSGPVKIDAIMHAATNTSKRSLMHLLSYYLSLPKTT